MVSGLMAYTAHLEAYQGSSRGFKGLKQAIKLEFKLNMYKDVCLQLLGA
jgi:hypothetical protein